MPDGCMLLSYPLNTVECASEAGLDTCWYQLHINPIILPLRLAQHKKSRPMNPTSHWPRFSLPVSQCKNWSYYIYPLASGFSGGYCGWCGRSAFLRAAYAYTPGQNHFSYIRAATCVTLSCGGSLRNFLRTTVWGCALVYA